MDNKSIKKHYEVLIADEKPTNKQRFFLYFFLSEVLPFF